MAFFLGGLLRHARSSITRGERVIGRGPGVFSAVVNGAERYPGPISTIGADLTRHPAAARGSNASRSPSLMKLIASTIAMMNTLGLTRGERGMAASRKRSWYWLRSRLSGHIRLVDPEAEEARSASLQQDGAGHRQRDARRSARPPRSAGCGGRRCGTFEAPATRAYPGRNSSLPQADRTPPDETRASTAHPEQAQHVIARPAAPRLPCRCDRDDGCRAGSPG